MNLDGNQLRHAKERPVKVGRFGSGEGLVAGSFRGGVR